MFNNGEVFKVLDSVCTVHRGTPCLAIKLSKPFKRPVFVIDSDPDSESHRMYSERLGKLAREAKAVQDPYIRKKAWTRYFDYKLSFAKFDYAYAQNCYKNGISNLIAGTSLELNILPIYSNIIYGTYYNG